MAMGIMAILYRQKQTRELKKKLLLSFFITQFVMSTIIGYIVHLAVLMQMMFSKTLRNIGFLLESINNLICPLSQPSPSIHSDKSY